MPFRTLTWIFGGLFVLLGLPLVLSEGAGGQRLWAGLSTLALGGFGLALAGDGLQRGEIRLQFSVIRRADKPVLFWAAVLLAAGAGAGVVVTGVWFLAFEGV